MQINSLDRVFPFSPKPELWGTVELGAYPTIVAIERAMARKGYTVMRYAHEILTHQSISPAKSSLDLYRVRVHDLSWAENEYLDVIYEFAREQGYALVPAVVGSLVLLQLPYRLDPGDRVAVGMEPMELPDERAQILTIDFGGGRDQEVASRLGYPDKADMKSADFRLTTQFADSDSVWGPDDTFLFCRERE